MEKFLSFFRLKAKPSEDLFPINQLPSEILVQIFEFCEAKDLKDASLVCVLWRDIIGLSASTMKKFHLNLLRQSKLESDPNFISQRTHINIICGNSYDFPFPRAGPFDLSRVRSINLRHVKIFYGKDGVLASLSQVPYLENLQINLNRFFIDDETITASPVRLKLKRLMIDNRMTKLLNFVVPESLITLKVHSDVFHFCGVNCVKRLKVVGNLNNVLEHAVNLKVLKIDLIELFDCAPSAFPFKLEHLKIFGNHFWPRKNVSTKMIENFERILDTQASTLQRLSLEHVPDFVFRILIGKLRRLTHLRVFAHTFDWSKECEEFYKTTKVADTLRGLICQNSLYTDKDFNAFMGLFPNVEDLTLGYLSLKNLACITKDQPRLKRLWISSLVPVSDVAETSTATSNVELLHVAHVHSTQDLLPILHRCPAIRCLEIVTFYDASDRRFASYIRQILQTPIKELRVGGCAKSIKTTVNEVKKNSGGLELLIVRS